MAAVCAAARTTGAQQAVPGSKTKNDINQRLAAQLDSIYDNDQKYRLPIDSVEQRYGRGSKEALAQWLLIDAADSGNTLFISRLLDGHGWPAPDEIGEQGEKAICVVVQHARLAVQEKYAPMMQQAVLAHKVAPGWYAILTDRVALREGKKQRYGSQLHGNPSGPPWVSPIEDPDHVDERRAAIGLEPMKDYLANWNIIWDLGKYKKELPEIEAKEKGGW